MLQTSGTQTPDALQDALQDMPPAANTAQAMRELIERLQGEIRFRQTTIEALNFEVARLKRWRFGTSSESLDNGAQAVRQTLPAGLPRVERHHEIQATHSECGQALNRIDEKVGEQLDCRPA
jgi:hypothetical protein